MWLTYTIYRRRWLTHLQKEVANTFTDGDTLFTNRRWLIHYRRRCLTNLKKELADKFEDGGGWHIWRKYGWHIWRRRWLTHLQMEAADTFLNGVADKSSDGGGWHIYRWSWLTHLTSDGARSITTATRFRNAAKLSTKLDSDTRWNSFRYKIICQNCAFQR
jgi:hypothetical protein